MVLAEVLTFNQAVAAVDFNTLALLLGMMLLFFGGLFVVIGGARQSGLLDTILQRIDISASVGDIVSIH